MKKIIALTRSDPSVVNVKRHFSIYMAPSEVVLQLLIVFKKDMDTGEITEAIKRISKNIQKDFTRVKQIFIEPA